MTGEKLAKKSATLKTSLETTIQNKYSKHKEKDRIIRKINNIHKEVNNWNSIKDFLLAYYV